MVFNAMRGQKLIKTKKDKYGFSDLIAMLLDSKKHQLD
jgi:predicted CopG family antitoxin